MRKMSRALPIVVGLLLYLHPQARAGIINFDSLNDGDIVTNQFPGLTFTNTIVLSAGISLNEFEFPPRSNSNVASDNGGPISILFSSPVLSFGGYFTYRQPVTLLAFDTLSNQVSTATSAFSTNDALFGDLGSSPNEFLEVLFHGGISRLSIIGDPHGGSFTLDDANVRDASIPEPSSLFSFLIGSAAVAVLHRKIRS